MQDSTSTARLKSCAGGRQEEIAESENLRNNS
jgi:hypothetical protein